MNSPLLLTRYVPLSQAGHPILIAKYDRLIGFTDEELERLELTREAVTVFLEYLRVPAGTSDEILALDWIWLGKWRRKYGVIYASGRKFSLHRFSYTIFNEQKIKPELIIRHLCPNRENPACANPFHLKEGTHQQGADDRERYGMTARGNRSGPRRHPEKMAHGMENHKNTLSDFQVQAIRATCARYIGNAGMLPALARFLRKERMAVRRAVRETHPDVPDNPDAAIHPKFWTIRDSSTPKSDSARSKKLRDAACWWIRFFWERTNDAGRALLGKVLPEILGVRERTVSRVGQGKDRSKVTETAISEAKPNSIELTPGLLTEFFANLRKNRSKFKRSKSDG